MLSSTVGPLRGRCSSRIVSVREVSCAPPMSVPSRASEPTTRIVRPGVSATVEPDRASTRWTLAIAVRASSTG